MTYGKKGASARTMPLACAALLVLAFSGSALAADGDDTSADAGPPPIQHHFEIHDEANSPPVNFRSEQDERYNTPEQHDAEMFAEEYERQRDEKLQKERSLLDNMNTVTSPESNSPGGNLGANDAGFPPRPPY
jgi:hypothetical protein